MSYRKPLEKEKPWEKEKPKPSTFGPFKAPPTYPSSYSSWQTSPPFQPQRDFQSSHPPQTSVQSSYPTSYGGFGGSLQSPSTTSYGGFGSYSQSPSATYSQSPSTNSYGGFGSYSQAPSTTSYGGFGSYSQSPSTTSYGGFGSYSQSPSTTYSKPSGFGSSLQPPTTSPFATRGFQSSSQPPSSSVPRMSSQESAKWEQDMDALLESGISSGQVDFDAMKALVADLAQYDKLSWTPAMLEIAKRINEDVTQDLPLRPHARANPGETQKYADDEYNNKKTDEADKILDQMAAESRTVLQQMKDKNEPQALQDEFAARMLIRPGDEAMFNNLPPRIKRMGVDFAQKFDTPESSAETQSKLDEELKSNSDHLKSVGMSRALWVTLQKYGSNQSWIGWSLRDGKFIVYIFVTIIRLMIIFWCGFYTQGGFALDKILPRIFNIGNNYLKVIASRWAIFISIFTSFSIMSLAFLTTVGPLLIGGLVVGLFQIGPAYIQSLVWKVVKVMMGFGVVMQVVYLLLDLVDLFATGCTRVFEDFLGTFITDGSREMVRKLLSFLCGLLQTVVGSWAHPAVCEWILSAALSEDVSPNKNLPSVAEVDRSNFAIIENIKELKLADIATSKDLILPASGALGFAFNAWQHCFTFIRDEMAEKAALTAVFGELPNFKEYLKRTVAAAVTITPVNVTV